MSFFSLSLAGHFGHLWTVCSEDWLSQQETVIKLLTHNEKEAINLSKTRNRQVDVLTLPVV